MNLSGLRDIKRATLIKLVLFFLILLIFPSLLNYIFIRDSFLASSEKVIKSNISNIKADLTYKKEKWSMDLYNSDPATPSPSSPSSLPLYIITTDGYVVERSRLISGLLDTADMKKLLVYSVPTTITTPTSETLRILSKPILKDKKIVGVVTVVHYITNDITTTEIDKELQKNIDTIFSKIKVINGSIKADNSQLKSIAYDVSYEIVSSFNKVIAINGRVPSYIDVSYVEHELNIGKRFVNDSKTGEKFLVISDKITDSKNHTIGLIVVGRSVNNLMLILNQYIYFCVISGLIFTILFTLGVIYLLKKDLLEFINTNKIIYGYGFKSISFDKKTGVIRIDKNSIQIPYSSNQYYLCQAIFSEPRRNWETDELLEKFGEDTFSGNFRKTYDAMLAVNKKVGIKLIIHADKTYRFNPELLEKLVK